MRAQCPPQLCLAAAFLTAAFLDSAAHAAHTEVSVDRSGELFVVQATSDVEADRTTAWQVLARYEDYPRFVPGLKRSRITGAEPLRVEQSGRFGILFFTREVAATLEIEEQPMSEIAFRAVAGDLRQLRTTVRIEGEGRRHRIEYRSAIEPSFWVPPVIGTSIIRIAIRGKLQAVAEEMERRAGGTKR